MKKELKTDVDDLRLVELGYLWILHSKPILKFHPELLVAIFNFNYKSTTFLFWREQFYVLQLLRKNKKIDSYNKKIGIYSFIENNYENDKVIIDFKNYVINTLLIDTNKVNINDVIKKYNPGYEPAKWRKTKVTYIVNGAFKAGN